LDLLELNDSRYIKNKLNNNYYVAMFYGVGSHKLYVELMTNKTAVQTTKALMNFI